MEIVYTGDRIKSSNLLLSANKPRNHKVSGLFISANTIKTTQIPVKIWVMTCAVSALF